MNDLGLTLIHSVWELAGIAAIFAVATLFLRKSSSQARYVAALVALMACAAAPIATFALLNQSTAPKAEQVSVPTTTDAHISHLIQSAPVAVSATPAAAISVDAPSPGKSIKARLQEAIPSLVMAWVVGLFFMSIRMIGGLIALRRVRRSSASMDDEAWQGRLRTIADKLGVKRRIEIRCSTQVDVPAVVGVLKAIILFPAAALTQLSPDQLEVLLAHEVAHIRRHDLAVNLFQSIVESVLFYHPAVWWISGILRTEREHACDDLAVQAIGNTRTYATALVAMEQARPSPRLAMSANSGSLLRRIQRLAGLGDRRLVPGYGWAVIALLLTISIGVGRAIGQIDASHAKRDTVTIVRGTITRVDGSPASSADVYLLGGSPEDKQWIRHAVTDESGKFSLSVPRATGLNVFAKAGKSEATIQEYFQMFPNEPIRLQLNRAEPIQFTVRDEKGAPVKDLLVGPFYTAMNGFTESLTKLLAVKTDSEGHGVIEGVPMPELVGLIDYETNLASELSIRRAASNDFNHLQCVVHPTCDIDGVVTLNGKPLIGPFGLAAYGAGIGFRNMQTDGQGHFHLSRVPAGDIRLGCFPRAAVAAQYIAPQTDVHAVSGQTQHTELKLQRAASLHVQVANQFGVPLPNIPVAIAGDHGASPNGAAQVTGKDGSFMTDVVPGHYKLTAHSPGGKSVTSDFDLKPAELRSVSMTCAVPASRLGQRRDKGFDILGKVKLDGRSVAGAKLYAFRYVDGFHTDPVFTDKLGNFRIHLKDGGQTMVRCIPPSELAKKYMAPAATVVLGKGKAPFVNVALQLSGNVHLTVLTIHGQLADHKEVEIKDVAATEDDFMVANTGAKCAVDQQLLPGTYAARVYRSDGKGFGKRFTIVGGETTTVGLKEPSEGMMTMVVAKVIPPDGGTARKAFVNYTFMMGSRRQYGIAITDSSGLAKIRLTKDELKTITLDARIDDEFSGPAIPPTDGSVTIRLHKVARVAAVVHVQDSNGNAVNGATLVLSNFGSLGDPEGSQITTVTTKSMQHGACLFSGLIPQDTYRLKVSADGYKPTDTILITARPGMPTAPTTVVLKAK